ncbi:splicesome-associated protein [Lentithecium fluviatile CBS 122367]|uniref:Splicesome-associated protein n=1 Tax=Lentithecium fluviatile CBS 122367 TaxID=1168545 RepID=A0A6G1J4K9_9PLEO|nr:splicesome-associated protein [Lentithecium fluviatile CBS 122367]
MLLEDQRQIHEDLERLEDAIADRLLDDLPHIRDRLSRDHEIARFLEAIENQSERLLKIYEDVDGVKDDEVRGLTHGDPMESFMNEIASIRDFHRRYPNEPVENLEKAYKRRPEDQADTLHAIEKVFTGEEGFGRFFDLTMLHEQYLNLPVHTQARRLTYLQYLDVFDVFTPPQCTIRRDQKMSEPYFQYLKALQDYLESFMRRTKPLENLDKIFANFDVEFVELWEKEEVPGWEKNASRNGLVEDDAPGEGIWCSACKKGFAKETVYEAHLMGKKHRKAVQESSGANSANTNGATGDMRRFKERAVAEREFRIRKLAAAMQTNRSDTKVNVERKQGMTERERQQELEELYSERPGDAAANEDDQDSDGEEKIYNPLKLPLAWDGKPIPFWLYKLHGLGVEFTCEICGNYVYMGRRAFDKHFNEPRHIYGLKCLGITNTTLFREITSIAEAEALWKKITKDKKKELTTAENVVEMEDADGNVMPEKVYKDLVAAGLV